MQNALLYQEYSDGQSVSTDLENKQYLSLAVHFSRILYLFFVCN